MYIRNFLARNYISTVETGTVVEIVSSLDLDFDRYAVHHHERALRAFHLVVPKRRKRR